MWSCDPDFTLVLHAPVSRQRFQQLAAHTFLERRINHCPIHLEHDGRGSAERAVVLALASDNSPAFNSCFDNSARSSTKGFQTLWYEPSEKFVNFTGERKRYS
eukprot:2221463-Pleurochrysis_carterae.AAC.1